MLYITDNNTQFDGADYYIWFPIYELYLSNIQEPSCAVLNRPCYVNLLIIGASNKRLSLRVGITENKSHQDNTAYR